MLKGLYVDRRARLDITVVLLRGIDFRLIFLFTYSLFPTTYTIYEAAARPLPDP